MFSVFYVNRVQDRSGNKCETLGSLVACKTVSFVLTKNPYLNTQVTESGAPQLL
jgi:hypothetical protein